MLLPSNKALALTVVAGLASESLAAPAVAPSSSVSSIRRVAAVHAVRVTMTSTTVQASSTSLPPCDPVVSVPTTVSSGTISTSTRVLSSSSVPKSSTSSVKSSSISISSISSSSSSTTTSRITTSSSSTSSSSSSSSSTSKATTSSSSSTTATTVASTSSSSATAKATAAAYVAPVPYVLGTMKWAWANKDAPASISSAIADSMDWTMNMYNTLTNFYGTVSTVYSSGTPTADASFLGQVRFGSQMSRRTALHEVNHWLGSGTVSQYRNLAVGGKFTGASANRRIRAFDGPSAALYSDGVHFWPYGMNYDNEFSSPQRTVGIVSSARQDLGWGDGTAAITGNRRFQNRASQLILDAGSDASATQSNSTSSGTQVWTVGFVDGFIWLTNSAGTLSLDSLGKTSNGALTAMYPTLTWHPNQHWEMIPTDNGWFMLRNKGTGTCLDNSGNQGEGAVMAMWPCISHPNQQWHLVY